MSWSSLREFLAMGGYAWYVWGSLAVVVLLIAIEVGHIVLSQPSKLDSRVDFSE